MSVLQIFEEQMGIVVNPHTFTMIAIFFVFLVPTTVFNQLVAQAASATWNFWGITYVAGTTINDWIVNLIPFALINVFNLVILAVSAKYFLYFYSVYITMYPIDSVDTYPMS